MDALSDDGAFGLVVIAFVGSVFSPYYARALRRGEADPENHVAINVALYGKGGHHWAMTERPQSNLTRDPTMFAVGPSRLNWVNGVLTIDISERTTPFLTRIIGQIRLTADGLLGDIHALDADGVHTWQPLAPSARVDVNMAAPRQRWSGHAYFDSNTGSRPITRDFRSWHWARASTLRGPVIHYDIIRRDGTSHAITLGSGADNGLLPIKASGLRNLNPTGWRIARQARCDDGISPSVRATFEDTPFYARSLIASRLDGEPVTLMHESLDCDRLASRWVETLLPFRMPRWRWRG